MKKALFVGLCSISLAYGSQEAVRYAMLQLPSQNSPFDPGQVVTINQVLDKAFAELENDINPENLPRIMQYLKNVRVIKYILSILDYTPILEPSITPPSPFHISQFSQLTELGKTQFDANNNGTLLPSKSSQTIIKRFSTQLLWCAVGAMVPHVVQFSKQYTSKLFNRS